MGTIAQIQENPTLWAESNAKLTDLVPPEWQDKPVFYDEDKGGKWSLHFPGNIMQIYPAGVIGLDSPSEELEIARNTVHILSLIHIFIPLNKAKGISFFPLAVSVGSYPDSAPLFFTIPYK